MKKKLSIMLSLVLFLSIASLSMAADLSGKKISFIDSYHGGYPRSDSIVKGVEQTLADTGVDLKIIHMDTNRNKGDAFMKEAAQKAKTIIESFKPDVVIAADDNASKYLIKPFLQGSWSAKAALKILNGTAPADIPIVKNTGGALVINVRISAKAVIELPFELIDSAEEVIE